MERSGNPTQARRAASIKSASEDAAHDTLEGRSWALRRLSDVTSSTDQARIGVPPLFSIENKSSLSQVSAASREKLQRLRRLVRTSSAAQRLMIAAFAMPRSTCRP